MTKKKKTENPNIKLLNNFDKRLGKFPRFNFFSDYIQEINKYRTAMAPIIKRMESDKIAYEKVFIPKIATLSDSFSKITTLESAMGQISKSLSTPASLAARSAVKSIAKILNDTNKFQDIISKQSQLAMKWQPELLKVSQNISQASSQLEYIKYLLTGISQMSLIAQSTINRIKENNIGHLLSINSKIKSDLSNNYLSLSTAYAKLFESILDKESTIFSFEPIVSKYPPVEFYSHIELIKAITIEDEEVSLENLEIHEDIDIETESFLKHELMELNPDFPQLLNGAIEALSSDNPDKSRYFTTSLRELITHVLHLLAPDEKVKSWSLNPEYYKNDKPTRSGRILYICRNINHGPFNKFVEKDVKALSEFINLFHRGTHSIKINYTEEQLRALLFKFRTSIRFLIDISKIS